MAVTNQETDDRARSGRRESGVEGRLLARYRRRLLSERLPLGAARVLDVGCGEGLLTGWLAEQLPGADVHGLEARASRSRASPSSARRTPPRDRQA